MASSDGFSTHVHILSCMGTVNPHPHPTFLAHFGNTNFLLPPFASSTSGNFMKATELKRSTIQIKQTPFNTFSHCIVDLVEGVPLTT